MVALWLIATGSCGCSGTATTCGSFSAQTACSQASSIGCDWQAGGACGGTHAACHTLPLETCTNTNVSAQPSVQNHGCYQAPGKCGFAYTPNCPTYNDATTCTNNACDWTPPGACNGTTRCSLTVVGGRCSTTTNSDDLTILDGCTISACSGNVDCTDYKSGSCPSPHCVDGPGCSQFNGGTNQDPCSAAGCSPNIDTRCGGVTVTVSDQPSNSPAAISEAAGKCSVLPGCRGDTALFNSANSYYCRAVQLSCDGSSNCANLGDPTCTVADCVAGTYHCQIADCTGSNACSLTVEHVGDNPTFNDGCQDARAGCSVNTVGECTPGATPTCVGTDTASCESTVYCAWTDGSCDTLGAGLICGALSQSDCTTENNGCAWNASAACGGSFDCTTLDSAQCATGAYPGCAPDQCSLAAPLGDASFRGGACRASGEPAWWMLSVLLPLLLRRKKRISETPTPTQNQMQ